MLFMGLKACGEGVISETRRSGSVRKIASERSFYASSTGVSRNSNGTPTHGLGWFWRGSKAGYSGRMASVENKPKQRPPASLFALGYATPPAEVSANGL